MIKKIGIHIAVWAFFLALVVVYFWPSVVEGKVVRQGDVIQFMGMSEEVRTYYEQEGKGSAWVGSMFSGMPAYQIAMYGTPNNYLNSVDYLVKAIDFNGASMVLMGLVCFYILMCIMGVNRWLAITGSIAFAFASYNIIIIVAGHVTKAYAIAYMPLTLAGMLLLCSGKKLWGCIVFTLGIAYSIISSHVQMTYYLGLFCLFMYIPYAIRSIKNKELKDLGKVSGIMILCILVAVIVNIGNLYPNYEMSKESMRGGSELTKKNGAQGTTTSGLERDYAFEWSYGRGELLTLLIPNAYGGESGGTLDTNSALYQTMKSHNVPVKESFQTYTYWGEQMFTSGPVYFGALVCFLFVLGLFVIRSSMKWWIAGASLFFIFLSLGRNMAWFNNFMFEYLPLYSKFRAPSMALVIPGLTFPIIAIWVLKEIFTGNTDRQTLKKGMIWSLSIVGGICFIIWVVPDWFLSFQSSSDVKYQLPDWYYTALVADRKSLASSDAFRSLAFILLGAGLLYYYIKNKNKKSALSIASAGLLMLVLIDLWGIDKRYLNFDSFVKEKPEQTYVASVADKEILKNTAPSYRVLNLNNTFQETNTSFFHKSVGGYHAAKLSKYQDLIDVRLSGEINSVIQTFGSEKATLESITDNLQNCPILNMLNTQYIIYNSQALPIENPYYYGNAWFVDSYRIVANADEEMDALGKTNLRKEAIIDRRYAENLEGLQISPDSTAHITLNVYKPDRLEYTSFSLKDGLAVFSEIYYPHGWKASIDGKEVPVFRTDWTLRGIRIPAGNHQIMFEFIPQTVLNCEMASSISSAVLVLLLIGLVVFSLWKREKKE